MVSRLPWTLLPRAFQLLQICFQGTAELLLLPVYVVTSLEYGPFVFRVPKKSP